MRIGYLFRGHLADVKLDRDGNEISTPDGNATYSWSIEHEAHRRGYKLIPLGENLDEPFVADMGYEAFAAFSKDKRGKSFERMLRRGWTHLTDKSFPDIDLVLVEWRWPIPGRNTLQDIHSPLYQTDLERQSEVLEHYAEAGTPIVVWDLDHKLSETDIEAYSLAGIDFRVIETSSTAPSRGRVSVEPPTVTADLLQHDIDERMPSHHIGYIGSRYERDETIDHWIKAITPPNTHRAKFWGKWTPEDEVSLRWPGITFSGRIGVKGFREAYSRVAVVPLLAKRSYYETGFITPRPWEAVLFGSIPVGLDGHLGVDRYVDRVVRTPEELLEYATWVRTMSPLRRRVLREESAHRLSVADVRNFWDVLEGLVGDAKAATDVTEERTEHV